MKGPEVLLQHEDHWVTDMGAWFPAEQRVVYRGKDLFHELNDLRWMGLLLYGITGRFFSEKQVSLFEGLWALSTSYPESRLWNNRVAALAGTARSTGTLAVGAAVAISEASIYGHRTNIGAIDFFLRTQLRLDGGANLTDLIRTELTKYRGIPGYGRPVASKDERIEPVMKMARKFGFADGPFTKLAFEVEEILLAGGWRLHMNITGLAAALAADQGLNAREYYHYVILCFAAGIIPCAIDAQEKPEASLFPLRCSRIHYEGKPRRVWKTP
jgi:citrate synthase